MYYLFALIMGSKYGKKFWTYAPKTHGVPEGVRVLARRIHSN